MPANARQQRNGRRASGSRSEWLAPTGPRNKQKRADCHACPSTTPPTATPATAAANKDARRSWCGGNGVGARDWRRGWPCGHRRRPRLGFIDQPESSSEQILQFGFARFIAGKFDQVAALQEFSQAVLLPLQKQV